jgi:endonuclease YncB( thermonuclease family)
MGRIAILPVLILAALAAGCRMHYEAGVRPFPKVDEFPELALPQRAAWKVVDVKDGLTLVVERVAPWTRGPLGGEQDLRVVANVPPWKPAGDGRFQVRLFGLRIPLVSDAYSNQSGDRAARAFLESFVQDRRVVLERTPVYNHAFVYVQSMTLEDVGQIRSMALVNLEMLHLGRAMADPAQFQRASGPRGLAWRMARDLKRFRTAEAEARVSRAGLWRFGP